MTDDTAPESQKPVPLRVVGGREAVRAAAENAEIYRAPAVPDGADKGGGGPGGPDGHGDWRSADWPVSPLGINGDTSYYLDASLQLRAYHFRDHTRLGVMHLWGAHSEMLKKLWPRTRADGSAHESGFDADACARDHMAAASAKGVWKPLEKVRGPGAWMGPKGELILHMGDEILLGPAPGGADGFMRADPGLIHGHVYPAAPPGPRPSPERQASGDKGPGAALLTILKTWNFRRGDLDALLMLGQTGAAMVGGALAWRPACWVTGQAGTGKSTLQRLLELIQGGSLIAVSDATAAGIWQKIGHSTYPVWVDEAEASDDNRRMDNVVRLARQASSGGLVLRGGQNHEGTEFKARSCFFFSAIDMPPLETQDMQRNAIFALGPLKDITPYTPDPELLRELGRRLLRRMVDGWTRYQVTLEIFRAALTDLGHTSRGADQFGNMLACAWTLLHDEVPLSDDAELWASPLKPDEIAEVQDAGAGERRCAKWLLSTKIDPYARGSKTLLGEWMLRAAGKTDRMAETSTEANRVIGMYGLRFRAEGGRDGFVISNNHRGLAEVYKDTRWASRPSAAQQPWVQQWRRLPGARWGKDFSTVVYFTGDAGRGTWVPFESVFADGYEGDFSSADAGDNNNGLELGS